MDKIVNDLSSSSGRKLKSPKTPPIFTNQRIIRWQAKSTTSSLFVFFLLYLLLTDKPLCYLLFLSRYYGLSKIRGNEFVETAQTQPSMGGPTCSVALMIPWWTLLLTVVEVPRLCVAALDCSQQQRSFCLKINGFSRKNIESFSPEGQR